MLTLFSYLGDYDPNLGNYGGYVGSLLAGVPSGVNIANRHFVVDTSMATGWTVPYSGASVQLPNRDKIQEMLNQAFGDAQ